MQRQDALGAVPRSSFKRVTVGPLSFDFVRQYGILTTVRVREAGDRDVFVLRFDEPRLQPLDHVLSKLLEDLYISAKEPDRVRSIAERMGVDPERQAQVEHLISWAADHREAIFGAAQFARGILSR
jgi:hypothetical protein